MVAEGCVAWLEDGAEVGAGVEYLGRGGVGVVYHHGVVVVVVGLFGGGGTEGTG